MEDRTQNTSRSVTDLLKVLQSKQSLLSEYKNQALSWSNMKKLLGGLITEKEIKNLADYLTGRKEGEDD